MSIMPQPPPKRTLFGRKPEKLSNMYVWVELSWKLLCELGFVALLQPLHFVLGFINCFGERVKNQVGIRITNGYQCKSYTIPWVSMKLSRKFDFDLRYLSDLTSISQLRGPMGSPWGIPTSVHYGAPSSSLPTCTFSWSHFECSRPCVAEHNSTRKGFCLGYWYRRVSAELEPTTHQNIFQTFSIDIYYTINSPSYPWYLVFSPNEMEQLMPWVG